MLTLILILSITVVLVVLTIIAFKRSRDETRALPKILVLLSSLFGVFLIACSTISITAVASGDKKYEELIQERTEIVDYAKENVNDSGKWDYQVSFYNFRLLHSQKMATNIWSSWFYSPRVLDVNTIKFSEITGKTAEYSLSYKSENTLQGTIKGTSQGIYSEDMTMNLTAEPNEGYKFVAWYYEEDDTIASWSENYIFKIKEDTSLIARFKLSPSEGEKDYRLTYKVTGEGTITGDRQGIYDHGDPITLTATPNEGYQFDGWWDNNSKTYLSLEQEVSFEITKVMDLVAGFVEITEEDVTP